MVSLKQFKFKKLNFEIELLDFKKKIFTTKFHLLMCCFVHMPPLDGPADCSRGFATVLHFQYQVHARKLFLTMFVAQRRYVE